MNVLSVILSILFFAISVGLIVIILLQSSRNAGLSGTLTGMTDTYWGKNKSNSIEGKLERYTKILATCFIIVAIVLNAVIR